MNRENSIYVDFSPKLVVAMSDISDGNMKELINRGKTIQSNAKNFLDSIGISVNQTVRVSLDYSDDNFVRYRTVGPTDVGDGMISESSLISDALYTRDRNVALFLPLADCIGAVLFDTSQSVLGLSHLGRHNLEQFGGERSVRYMMQKFGSKPTDVKVVLTAAAGKLSYPMHAFDGRGLHEVAIEQLRSVGIPMSNIFIDERDTVTDKNLYSHSQTLKDANSPKGRQAVVAMMRP